MKRRQGPLQEIAFFALLCFALNLPAFIVGDDNEIFISQISSCLHRETHTYTNSSEWKVSGLVIHSKIFL